MALIIDGRHLLGTVKLEVFEDVEPETDTVETTGDTDRLIGDIIVGDAADASLCDKGTSDVLFSEGATVTEA